MVLNQAPARKGNQAQGKVALITGANTGIGKEVARQLALTGEYGKIYLACRNEQKAGAAKQSLEETTGKSIFQIVRMDVSDPASVQAALSSLDEVVDDLVMNAGGVGGKTPLALTRDGVTEIFAANVLGHVVLLEGLLRAGKLGRAAVYVGSEAARGVPKLGMKRPVLATSSADEFASLCDGTYFRGRKADPTLAYGQVKYVAALWMAATARRYPHLRLLTVSPGSTRGSEVARDAPLPLRLLLKFVLMPVVFPLFGLVHNLDVGARRLIDALHDDALKSGAFYASKANTLSGPMMDQSEVFPDLANPLYQDHASEAMHRFVRDAGGALPAPGAES